MCTTELLPKKKQKPMSTTDAAARLAAADLRFGGVLTRQCRRDVVAMVRVPGAPPALFVTFTMSMAY
jgi:hypothetical protein